MTSDYYFLEDVGRFVDSAHRDRICHNRQQGSKSKVEWTSHAHVLLSDTTVQSVYTRAL